MNQAPTSLVLKYLQVSVILIIIIIIAINIINPIPAGVLENQDTLGGGQFDPPL